MSAAERTLRTIKIFRARRLAAALKRMERGDGRHFSDLANVLARSAEAAVPLFRQQAETVAMSLPWGKLDGDAYVEDAEEIMRHRFDLLGSGRRDFSESEDDDSSPEAARGGYRRINWHRDIKSGVEWEREVLYPDVQTIRGDGSDIILAWELSRFQHLPTLGAAWHATGDERYAREFVDEINDWIEENPPLYGVNWACPMEAAIRAVNWIWGYCLFAGSPPVDNGFLATFLESLYIHAMYIRKNLQRPPRLVAPLLRSLGRISRRGVTEDAWRGLATNHYLCDLVGLVYIGTLFSEADTGAKWRAFAAGELVREMRALVYADGVYYEGTISYHALACELFLSATLLCQHQGITFPAWYMERLERMIEFVLHYTKPDGKVPLIGDSDDGRLQILEGCGERDPRDHRYLRGLGAALFERSDLDAASPQDEQRSSRCFPYGGYYVMRSGGLYMIMDCLPTGPRVPSGHMHNSRLSFELYAHDKSFIVDPGTYVYGADARMRNAFRGTAYHNTIAVDGSEQNRLDEDVLFGLGRDAAVRVNRWEMGEERDLLDAEHRGYERLARPVVHRRRILFLKRRGYWIVKDTLTGEGVHRFDLRFHFAPLAVEPLNGIPLAVRTRTRGADLALIPLRAEGLSLEMEEGWVSFRYGVKEEAPVARYSCTDEVPVTITCVLYPFTAEVDAGETAVEVDLSEIAAEAAGLAADLT